MKSAALATFALVTISMVGCCSMNQCVGPDDPCGRELAGGGWPLQGLQLKSKKCNPYGNSCGCGSYGYSGGEMYATGCSTGQCGAIAPAATNCGCGQPHGEGVPNAAPHPIPAPHPQAAPAPIPAAPPAPPVEGPVSSQYLPPTVPVPTSAVAPQGQASPQQVSYEEFQRLPGVIISGPAPAMTAPATTNAVPSTLTAPQPAVKPATWSSSR